MVTRKDWIDNLRSFEGVKFLHQGRTRNGVDCVGLITASALELGLHRTASMEITGYANVPDHRLFTNKLPQYLDEVSYNRLQPIRQQAKPGDIFVFWIERRGIPRHLAVYSGIGEHGYDSVIHAYAREPRKVLEMQLEPGYWNQRLMGIWQVPGLED